MIKFSRSTSKSLPSNDWVRVRALVRPHRQRVALLAVISLIGGVLEAAFLVGVTRTALAIADGRSSTGLFAGRTLPLGGAVAIAVGLLVARLVLALIGVAVSTTLSLQVSSSLRRRLAGTYLHAAWSVQQAEPTGRFQQLVMSFAGTAVGVVGSFAGTITAALNLVALILVAVVVDPAATLVVIAALGTLGSVLAPLRRRIRLRSRTAAMVQMEFATSVAELGALGLEMQTYGVRDRFVTRTGRLIDRDGLAQRQSDILRASLAPIYTSLAYGALLAGLGVAALVGAAELSSLGAVMLVMLRSLSYGQQLQVASGNLMASMPYLEQLDTTIERYEAQQATSGEIQADRVGAIQLCNVSFAYQADRPILHNVTFRVEAGEVVGVIGPSGAGKSTLVQLLLGLRDPTEGTVTVNGIDLRTVSRESWAHRVAFVAQDALLYTGTVADNIRFFRDGIDDDELLRAAKRANIATDVEAMAERFETHLGERGANLSGGQRQRLSIARALAGRPELLILDEPTSALDVHSETLIRETVSELKGDATVIIIAHRMSTLDVCDRIMVIEAGHLMAFDSPEHLRERSEFYRQALMLSGMT